MAKKITSEQVVEKDLFAGLQQEVDDLTKKLVGMTTAMIDFKSSSGGAKSVFSKEDLSNAKAIDDTLKSITETLKSQLSIQKAIADNPSFDSIKDVAKLQKALEKLLDITGNLDTVEKERLKLKRQLEQANTAEAKSNAVLKARLTAQRKEIREQAKEEANLLDAFQLKAKELAKLQKKLKESIITDGAAAESTKELGKQVAVLRAEIDEAEKAAGQFQRNVGNYPDGANEATEATEELTDAFEAQQKELSELQKELKRTIATQGKGSKESKKLGKQIRNLNRSIKQTEKAAAKFDNTMRSIPRSFSKLQAGIISIESATNLLSTALGSIGDIFGRTSAGASVFQKITGGLELSLTTLLLTFQDGAGILSGGGGWSDILSLITAKFGDLTKGIEANNKAVDDSIKNARELGALEVEVARLVQTQAKLQQQAEDDTTSLQKQLEATRKLIVVNKDIADQNEVIAGRRLDQIKKVQAAEKLAGEVSIATLDAVRDAEIALIDAQGETTVTQLENTELRNKIRRDEAELQLDVNIDTFDKIKTINERIIANERATLEKRRDLLKETKVAAKNALNEQVAILEELSGVTINANEILTLSDARAVSDRLEALGVEARVRERLREVVDESLLATQDLIEAEQDLTDVEVESAEAKADIALQQELLNAETEKGAILTEELTKLEDKRLEQTITNLQTRLAAANEGSARAIDIEQQLNEALIEQQTRQADKEKELQEKRLKQQEEFTEKALELTKNALDKQNEERLSAIDEELKAVQSRRDNLERLAQEGAENAERNLATEQRREAELEREKEQQIKRQARQELVLAAVETYSAKVQAGDENALTSTVADVAVLTQLINNLPTFWEGAEHVGQALGAPDLAGRDGHVVRVDGGERVVPTHINKQLGGVSNDMLPDLINAPAMDVQVNDNTMVIEELKALKSAIMSRQNYTGSDFDTFTKILSTKFQKGNSTEIVRRKFRG